MSEPARRRRRAQLAALCVSILVVVATTPVVQGVYSDAANQLKAVQQRLAGESTSINVSVHPESTDLSKDASQWILWWTPGTQLVVYPLMRTGLSLGQALRVVAAVALIAGSLGWATWFSYFAMPDAVLLALAAVFPCVRYGSNSLFLYSAEPLVFAAGPWMLVATVLFLGENRLRPRGHVFHAILGLGLGAAYWLKDSLAFVVVGALVTVAIVEWRAHSRQLIGWLGRCAAIGVGAAIPFLTLSTMNRVYGGSTTKVAVGLTAHLVNWRFLVDALALPALQMTDTFSLWDYVLMHPSHPVLHDVIWLSVIGVPGGALMWWLFIRPAVASTAGVLARMVLVCSLGILVGIWTISAAVDHMPRHIATAAFAILPLVISEGWQRWPRLLGMGRLTLAAAGLFYVCLPLTYGAVSVVAKVRRFPSGYRPGPAHIYNPQLAERDVASVRETLLARTSPDAVWYLSDALSALDLPGRSITVSADFELLEDLTQSTYVTSTPLKVRALFPARFETDGKGDAIRHSFRQAGPWTSAKIPGSDYWLWTADLAAGR